MNRIQLFYPSFLDQSFGSCLLVDTSACVCVRARARSPLVLSTQGKTMADVVRQMIELFESYPRFKDQCIDPLRASAGHSATARGALVLRGPVKMLQTVAMITKGSKADATAERFKALISRTKWVEQVETFLSLPTHSSHMSDPISHIHHRN